MDTLIRIENMFYKCHVITKDNGTIYIVIGVWLETHIKRHVLFFFFFFFVSFFCHMSVSGCLVSRYGKFTPLALWHAGGEPP